MAFLFLGVCPGRNTGSTVRGLWSPAGGPGRVHLFDAGTWETRLAMYLLNLFCSSLLAFGLSCAVLGRSIPNSKHAACWSAGGCRQHCRNT